MTLHAAKGLEFPHVFLAGVEEDFLPHRKAVAEGDRAIDEERRLLYVGITRARRALVITWAASRGVHGRARPRQPSRFLVDPGVAGLLAREDYDPRAEASGEEVRDYLDLYRKLKTR
jgi:superfamily I DNA/RNA helicase